MRTRGAYNLHPTATTCPMPPTPTTPKQTSTPTAIPEDEVIEPAIRPHDTLRLPEHLLCAEVREGSSGDRETHQGDTPMSVEREGADVALLSNDEYNKLLQEVTEEMARTTLSSNWMNEVVERSIAVVGDGVSRGEVEETVIKTAIPKIELSLRQVSESILNATQKVQ